MIAPDKVECCTARLLAVGRILIMRLWMISLLIIVTSSCATTRQPASSWVSGPARAQEEAEAYVLNLKPQPIASERDDILRDFTVEYFQGFTDPDARLIGPPAAKQGFQKGQSFRRHCNKAEVRRFMQDYGYTVTEASGTWAVRFEVSCFCPRNNPDEGWWLSYFGDTKVEIPEDDKKSDQAGHYQITGFLSPKGRYGHLGGYSHQFYATKIVYIKAGD